MMRSLDQVIKRLEQGAQRCDEAVALFDETIKKATPAVFPQKVLEYAAEEAKKTFEAVYEEVLPVIDAIEVANRSDELAKRCKAVRDLSWKHSPRAIKRNAADSILAGAQRMSIPVGDRTRQGVELLADMFGAMSPWVKLTKLSNRLRYAAGYLRTTYALQPPDTDPHSVHHGDVIMGTKFTTMTGSTVGAVAVGDHATATGAANIQQGPLTQAQHLEHIKTAKKALADDEDRLDDGVYEMLEKFIKLARGVQVESRAVGEVQAEMEGILDRVWPERSAKALPKGLKVAESLAKSPAMVGVAKKVTGE